MTTPPKFILCIRLFILPKNKLDKPSKRKKALRFLLQDGFFLKPENYNKECTKDSGKERERKTVDKFLLFLFINATKFQRNIFCPNFCHNSERRDEC